MQTQILKTTEIEKAAEILRKGGLVVFPTETVYGLGANAFDEGAVRNIYNAKGRPSDNPLIVHIGALEDLEMLVEEVPEMALRLMEAFWPGPLTLVLRKSPKIGFSLTGGLGTVAVRMPSNSVALALIRAAGVPVAAPSANLSGRPSPTRDAHVLDDLEGRVDAIILGGEVTMGLESTVVDCTGEIPTILRPGFITREDLLEVLPQVHGVTGDIHPGAAPPSPGMKYRHYAPRGELVMLRGSLTKEGIEKWIRVYEAQGRRVGLMMTTEMLQEFPRAMGCDLGEEENLSGVAARVFECLRQLDNLGAEVILTRSFPKKGLGVAIMNRLEKALSRTIEAEGGENQ
ncbi:MAG: hypothetical protein AVO33_07610 [delta proteobacterium ML8_F1]|nr:MAG: hypothetical protein AVO33_07610 [delta proteobacterium ML8_F1]